MAILQKIETPLTETTQYTNACEYLASKYNLDAWPLNVCFDLFFDVSISANKDADGVITGYYIKGISWDKYKLAQLLLKLGFCTYSPKPGEYVYIKIENNICSTTDKTRIHHAIVDTINAYHFFYIDNEKLTKENGELQGHFLPSEKVLAKFYNTVKSLLNDDLMGLLRWPKPIVFQEDTETEKFLFYQNVYIKVTAKDVQVLEYNTLQNFIWESQKLKRNFDAAKPQIPSTFGKFIKHISGYPVNKAQNVQPEHVQRLQSFMSLIGRAIHHYFKKKRQSAILVDSQMDDLDNSNGRSGKGLICDGIGHMVNVTEEATAYVSIDGKTFDKGNKHRYDSCEIDTKLVQLEDLDRRHDMEQHFNDIVKGIKVDKKNEKPFVINAFMIFTSNRMPKIMDPSTKDRIKIFEVSNYFNDKHEPAKEYGHWLFTDWEGPRAHEWHAFDHYMIDCIQLYLKQGFKEPPKLNADIKMLYEITSRDFVEYIESRLEGRLVREVLNSKNEMINIDQPQIGFGPDNKIVKAQLLRDITEALSDLNNSKFKFTQNKLTIWLNNYSQLSTKYSVESKPSNGEQYYIFNKKQKPE